MAIKILIAEACLVPGADGMQHADINDVVELDKEDAHALTRHGRAFYLEKADDPSKIGRYTADADTKARLKRLASEVEAERKARAERAAAADPAGLSALIAAQVAAAVKAALAPAK